MLLFLRIFSWCSMRKFAQSKQPLNWSKSVLSRCVQVFSVFQLFVNEMFFIVMLDDIFFTYIFSSSVVT